MSKSLNILSTKKLSNEQLEILEKIGPISHFDIIQTSSILDTITPMYSNIIFTSFKGCQYGLNALGESAKNYSYLCVGEKSKKLLEQHGLKVEACKDYAHSLTDKLLITRNYSYITGSKRLDTIPSFLTKNKFTFEEITAYKSEVNENIPKDKKDIILWFSPGGVDAYYKYNNLSPQTKHYCIGNTTRKALEIRQPNIPQNLIQSLHKPSTDDLVNMVCKNIKSQ